ncbi:hypothetical protein Leryth_012490 [Lithospermum erythrorhizon]|nr:hypothetical protein Leryth_012490 [Lithospermum erythrorhizon]
MLIVQRTPYLLLSFFFICILVMLIRILRRIWWTPIHIQHQMRSQEINGPVYNFLHGNTKEIINMRRESTSQDMEDLSHDILPRILPHIHSWRNSYGANFLYWIGPKPQLVITEVDLVKEVLTNKIGNFPKLDLEGYSKRLLGDGLSSSKGEKWSSMRKLASHAFHRESLKNMIPGMITSVDTMLEKWKEFDGKEVEVFGDFRVLTSEIISKTAFGSNYLEGKNIFEMLIKLAQIVARNAHTIRFPVISRFVRTRDELESEKLEQGIKDCITQIIKKRQQGKHDKGDCNRDFLGELLQANDATDKRNSISLEDMVDECKTFYFAGHETTASLLGWTILLLAIHKDWQDRARHEVITLFGLENPNADGLSKMQLMNMILEESLRLYPPVPVIKRKVTKHVSLKKLTLPPQLELYISPLALHHDPKIWGEDVLLFKPERFSGGVIKASNNNPSAFLPFGFGPRTCVGLNFAMIEAKIALSKILQRYMFTLSPAYIHSPVQPFMLQPEHGIQVILYKL